MVVSGMVFRTCFVITIHHQIPHSNVVYTSCTFSKAIMHVLTLLLDIFYSYTIYIILLACVPILVYTYVIRMYMHCIQDLTKLLIIFYRISMQGADILCGLEVVKHHSTSEIAVRNLGELAGGRRYTLNDQLVTALLHGVRMCLQVHITCSSTVYYVVPCFV